MYHAMDKVCKAPIDKQALSFFSPFKEIKGLIAARTRWRQGRSFWCYHFSLFPEMDENQTKIVKVKIKKWREIEIKTST